MSFKSPRTWIAELANAAQFNADVRDQFASLWPYTTKGDLAVATDANNITRLAVGADNTYLAADSTQPGGIKWSSAGLVPIGGIILWYGSVASIPSGWALCDGTVGTPDLSGRFVVGAGGTYSPGDTGGAVFSMPAHTHAVTIGLSSAYGLPGVPDYTNQSSTSDHYHNSTNTASGSDATTFLPSFRSLCYIMRIS